MALILLVSNIWLSLEHVNETLWQLWLYKVTKFPVMDFHFKYSSRLAFYISREVLAVVSQIVQHHFKDPWVSVKEHTVFKLFELVLALECLFE